MIIYFRIFIILSIANEPGLEPEDFLHGEEIDIDNEIPDGEDPLKDAHENGKKFQAIKNL